MNPITVLIVDDHTVAREGLRAMLETDQDVMVVGEAVDGQESLLLASELHPQVVLMDIRMPGIDGLEVTRRLVAMQPDSAVIIMTTYDDDALVIDAVVAGAAGYLLKDVSRDLLSYTIGAVATGGILIKNSLLRRAVGSLTRSSKQMDVVPVQCEGVDELTERENCVLRLLAKGLTNKDIADSMSLSEATIKKHVQSIMGKLRASGRTDAAVIGLRIGLIE